MSQFLREFEAVLNETNGGSGSAIFKSAGLDPATLSRMRHTGLKLQFEDLKAIAAAIGTQDMIYLRLLRARLLDECTDKRAGRISIEIEGGGRNVTPVSAPPPDDCLSKLPPRQERAMRNIADNLALDAGLRGTILWLGEDLFSPDPAAAEPSLNEASGTPEPPAKPGKVNYRKGTSKRSKHLEAATASVVEIVKRLHSGGRSAK